MSNNIKIIASGGAVSLGNIVQGGNQASAVNSASVIDQEFQTKYAAITSLGKELQLPSSQIHGAIELLEKLKAESKAPTPAPDKGASILKAIRENYAWAYPLMKDFLSIAWPAVLMYLAV